MILKCKICGGDIEANEQLTVGVCKYCGSTITLPRIDSEKKARLFNRANQYRLNCEFDKAYDAYNSIVAEDDQEPEAYWGMILSEYGVEYVEDPSTKKMIPTCHRTQLYSVQSTTNYEYACKYADSDRKFIYQDEAEEIDRIQKGILSISSKEAPYDVFICYKESDSNGQRTEDSVLAQEIYSELDKQGLKVFFSRISLAEKLGSDFEPYIYAALQSAKVMLVIGMTNENLNSVWVKNEWSRFIHFMQGNSGKTLIPVYKNMNTYELPDALKKFQAQDMGKVGAMQDLVYSVTKLATVDERVKKDSALEELIRERLEKERRAEELKAKRHQAKTSFEKIAKKWGPRVAILIAVIVLILVGKKVYSDIIYPNSMYNKATRLMEEGHYDEAIELFAQLDQYKNSVENTNEAKYLKAMKELSLENYDSAIAILQEIGSYKDSDEVYSQCLYGKAEALLEKKDYGDAAKLFESLGSYKDASSKCLECHVGMQLMDTSGTDAQLIKDTLSFADKYDEEQAYVLATYFYNLKKYDESIALFKRCGEYKDSLDMVKNLLYDKATGYTDERGKIVLLHSLATGEGVAEALGATTVKDSYKYDNAAKTLVEIVEPVYQEANSAYNEGKWGVAKKRFARIVYIDYKDVDEKYNECLNIIKEDKARYDGIWLNDSGTMHLKIQDDQISYSKSKASEEKKVWLKLSPGYSYDEDTGKLEMHYNGSLYLVTVNGNRMTITWEKDANMIWNNDNFNGGKTFTKSSY